MPKNTKQSSLFPSKPLLNGHRKTSSILQKRPNLILMKWNDFLEKYHTNKQMSMINNSIGLVNTYFRQRQAQLQITDVPYITSEQADIQSRVTNTHKNSVEMPISHINNSLTNSVFTQPDTTQNPAFKMSIHFQQEDLSDNNLDSRGQSDSQNFTDEEQQQKRSISEAEDSKKFGDSKKTLTTNRASSVIERWPVWEIEKETESEIKENIYVDESLRKTAFFNAEEQLKNQQNINRSNQTKGLKYKVEVLRKGVQDKGDQILRKKMIREDKKYLGKFLKRKTQF